MGAEHLCFILNGDMCDVPKNRDIYIYVCVCVCVCVCVYHLAHPLQSFTFGFFLCVWSFH